MLHLDELYSGVPLRDHSIYLCVVDNLGSGYCQCQTSYGETS